jgi:hypothetical protein
MKDSAWDDARSKINAIHAGAMALLAAYVEMQPVEAVKLAHETYTRVETLVLGAPNE